MVDANTGEELEDAVRAILIDYGQSCVDPTWKIPDIHVQVHGPEVRIFDAERRPITSGRTSATIFLAGDFWAKCAAGHGIEVARIFAPEFASRISCVPTLVNAFAKIGLFLCKMGQIDEGLFTLLHCMDSPGLSEARDVMQEHAPGVIKVIEDFDKTDRGLTLAQAARYFQDGISRHSPAERACVIGSLEGAVAHFLSTRKLAGVLKAFMPTVVDSVGNPLACVCESGLAAMACIANHAWAERNYHVLRACVPKLIAEGVDLRENLARLFELELIDGNRAAADASWRRCQSLAPLWPSPHARSIYKAPDWNDRRGIALTQAGSHCLESGPAAVQSRGTELLAEALEWIEPRLSQDLCSAAKVDARGFVYSTIYWNGRAADMSGDRERAHELYTRARNVYTALVTSASSTSLLDDAVERTSSARRQSDECPAAVRLLRLMMKAERVRLIADAPTERLIEDLERCLVGQPTVETVCEVLLEHPDVEELFASNDELERLLEMTL